METFKNVYFFRLFILDFLGSVLDPTTPPQRFSSSTKSVSTNFRLDLIDPSAREDEGQQVFFSSGAVSSRPGTV